MFGRSVEFPVVFAPWEGLDPDQAVRLAVDWWRKQPGEHLVLFHTKGMLQNNNILARLVRETRGAQVESYQTVRRSSWRGGPVLAPWPSEKVLGALDDDLAPPSAVAIVQWGTTDTYVRSWLDARHAHNLHTDDAAGGRSGLISPVVRVAMEELSASVNHNNALLQASDKAEAVRTLQALVGAGYRYDVDSLAAWAAANGFTSAEVDNLRDYASRVLEGRQFRLASGFDYPYGPQTLRRWRERTAK